MPTVASEHQLRRRLAAEEDRLQIHRVNKIPVGFLDPERIQGELLQGVRLTDADGSLWLATYRLERQPDRSWRISGCDVQPSSGKVT